MGKDLWKSCKQLNVRNVGPSYNSILHHKILNVVFDMNLGRVTTTMNPILRGTICMCCWTWLAQIKAPWQSSHSFIICKDANVGIGSISQWHICNEDVVFYICNKGTCCNPNPQLVQRRYMVAIKWDSLDHVATTLIQPRATHKWVQPP